jgi:hypothetical protein
MGPGQEPVRVCPYRSPKIVAEALKGFLQGRSVCDVSCAEGDMLAAMAKYARHVTGFDKDPRWYRLAQERGFEVVVGDYFLDELPQAEVYYLWSDHGARDNEFIINKLLARDDFAGLIIVGGNANIPSEARSVRRCAEKGKLLQVPFSEGDGYRQHGIFLLAIIDAQACRQSLSKKSSERRAVVTLAVGDSLGELAALTVPSQQAYAQRLGADYLVIRKLVIDSVAPFYEIFQLHDFFDTYDRILYLDLDVLVRNDCPNLFHIVPASDLGVFFESPLKDWSEEISQIQKEWRPLGWSRDYFNNGVMVMSRRHQVLFKPEFELPRKVLYFNQTVINYLAQAHGLSFYDLGFEFNYMPILMWPSVWFNRFSWQLRRLLPEAILARLTPVSIASKLIPSLILTKLIPKPRNAYMVHYAGFTYKDKRHLAAMDLAHWERATRNQL